MRSIIAQVRQGQRTRQWLTGRGGDDGFRDGPRVEALGSVASDTLQRCRVSGVTQHLPFSQRLPLRQQVTFRILAQRVHSLRLTQKNGQARRNRETIAGKTDSGLPGSPPRQAPELAVCHFEHGYRPGNPGGPTTLLRFEEGQRLAFGIEEQLGRRAARSDLAPVIGHYIARGSGVMQQKSAAANPRRLRLHEPEYRLHGDGCVDRGTTLSQHLQTRIDRQRIGGGHHGTCTPRRVGLRLWHFRQTCLRRRGRALGRATTREAQADA